MSGGVSVSALDNILFRLATLEDDKLGARLAILLPNLLEVLVDGDREITAKVAQVLTAINGRLTNLPNLQLPVLKILELFWKCQSSSPTAATFCMVYISKGVHRTPSLERIALIPLLLKGISSVSLHHRKSLYHAFLECIEHNEVHQVFHPRESIVLHKPDEVEALRAAEEEKKRNEESSAMDVEETKKEDENDDEEEEEEEEEDGLSYLSDDKDRQVVLSLVLDTLLYVANFDGPCPPGLSSEAVDTVTNGGKRFVKEHAALSALKFKLIEFISSQRLFPNRNDILRHVVVSSVVGLATLNNKADTLLRTFHADIDLESDTVVTGLMSLFLGSRDNKTLEEGRKRYAVDTNVRVKILQILSRSELAANKAVLSFKVFAGAISSRTSARLTAAGMEYLSWMCAKADKEKFQPLLKVYIKTLLGVITQKRPPNDEEKKQGITPNEVSRAFSFSMFLSLYLSLPIYIYIYISFSFSLFLSLCSLSFIPSLISVLT